eukprot:g3493.t1
MSSEKPLDDNQPTPSRREFIKEGAQMYVAVAKKSEGKVVGYSFFLVDILKWTPKNNGRWLGKVQYKFAEKKHDGTLQTPPEANDFGILDFDQDNEELHDYIFNWFAHLIQRPWDKTRVGMVILGEKGATKGITVAPIVKLIGSHAVELTQGDHVTGNFNAVLLNKTLVIMNEATWGGDKSGQSVIRGLITDDWFALTKKGIDTKGSVRSYHNFLYMSNHPWVVPNTPRERRYCCFELDPKWANLKGTPQHKAHIDSLLSVDPSCLLKWLLARDISTFDPTVYPETEAGHDQTEQSLTSVQSFMLGVLRGDIATPDCGLVEEIGLTTDHNGIERELNRQWVTIDSIFSEPQESENMGIGTLRIRRTNSIKVHKANFFAAYQKTCRGNGKSAVDNAKFWQFLRKTTPEYGCGMTCFNKERTASGRARDKMAMLHGKQQGYEDMVTHEEAIKLFRVIVGDSFTI